MYYFSYGANMSQKEMNKFTSNKFISYGTLKDYILIYRKILNHSRHSGVATIEPCKNENVYGKIYWIDNYRKLDKKEGYLDVPKIYNKHYININGYYCMVYILNPLRSGKEIPPRKSYFRMIEKEYNPIKSKKKKHLKSNLYTVKKYS